MATGFPSGVSQKTFNRVMEAKIKGGDQVALLNAALAYKTERNPDDSEFVHFAKQCWYSLGILSDNDKQKIAFAKKMADVVISDFHFEGDALFSKSVDIKIDDESNHPDSDVTFTKVSNDDQCRLKVGINGDISLQFLHSVSGRINPVDIPIPGAELENIKQSCLEGFFPNLAKLQTEFSQLPSMLDVAHTAVFNGQLSLDTIRRAMNEGVFANDGEALEISFPHSCGGRNKFNLPVNGKCGWQRYRYL